MRSLLLGTTLLVASATLALAQAPETTAPAPSPTAPVQAAPATLANDLRPTFVVQNKSDMVTSKLVGLTIQNGANETIGEIADVVLDEKNTVKAWVVGVGGFLGIGTKYVAIDPSALKLARVDDATLKATIDTTKDQLRAAPEYVYLGKTSANAAKTNADAKPAETKPVEAPKAQ
ncbi:PRC-barrel domain-containing protein [Methylobacterium sp. J-068]|uniref:PRC-barrel domain-containing protein n=1 Tax=Methylobacterium sp. J-068 TaxID=2836649 RepID=UPI001FB9C00E|nr:PRC-barrel domain-containing protein [Methylobacterium sp. J-068]MCJ2036759.1 PRC-barrel domain-containing protein [Methylobacterium sp. J-068]